MDLFVHAPKDPANNADPRTIYTLAQLKTKKLRGKRSSGQNWIVAPGAIGEHIFTDFDLYPLALTGEGVWPDPASLTFDTGVNDGGNHKAGAFTGDAVAVQSPAESLTKTEFLDRFTDAEMDVMVADRLTQGHANRIFLTRLDRELINAPYVEKSKQKNIDMLNGLEALGYLAAGRAAEILA